MKKKTHTDIRTLLKAQGRSLTWLATELGMTPEGLYKLRKKPLSKWKKPYVEVLIRHGVIPKP